MAIETIIFPLKIVIFHSFLYVYQRVFSTPPLSPYSGLGARVSLQFPNGKDVQQNLLRTHSSHVEKVQQSPLPVLGGNPRLYSYLFLQNPSLCG
jgi:hypothetical protein